MSQNKPNRRSFLKAASAGAAAVALIPSPFSAYTNAIETSLALLGGKPVRTKPFPSWPVIEKTDKERWLKVLQEGKWCRLNGRYANSFEKAYAELMGTKYCTVTANGTSALFTSLNALGIGPGDEVLVPPYTFIATVNAVLLQFALPVFIDTDRETFQMDATKIEAAITGKTACILPVHLGGNAANMDAILSVSQKRSLPVIEDACQAHLGEWRGKKLGSLGACGCFSFQASKNINSGEGGAIITNDGDFMERCYVFHNNGHGRTGSSLSYTQSGANLRMTEFQAALLLEQMTRLEDQSRTREQNAQHLTRQLQQIPGIYPAKSYDGCTRNAYHLYMFRYDKKRFAGAPRAQFLKALHAEGIPCSSGYRPLNKEAFLLETLQSKAYKAIYSPDRLRLYQEANQTPENDQLCQEAVWFTQTMFLGERTDMDHIAAAIGKIQQHAGELAKAS